ncbi:MAG: nitroreductase family deazaflavin-dependent oxidoreductase [Rubrobacter sp.]|nr:nitroreductase family deazaflavin-dependent oxidoreductase [Rubrobacter sp.]
MLPDWWAGEEYCYLTTAGRRTGCPHEVELWFALYDGRVYIVSGGGDRADWVKNLRVDPSVTIRVGSASREATAKVLGNREYHPARQNLAAKYSGWREGEALPGWAKRGMLIELSPV